MPCWDYFPDDLYDPEREDEAIHTVRSDPFLSKEDKKWLILCWFQVVYGGRGQDTAEIQGLAREAIRKFLQRRGLRSLEEAV